MPYLTEGNKEALAPIVEAMAEVGITDPAELNYLVCKATNIFLGDQPRYRNFNAAMGAIECAKLEIQRRLVAPYEMRKAQQNGDIFLERP